MEVLNPSHMEWEQPGLHKAGIKEAQQSFQDLHAQFLVNEIF